MSVLLEAWRTGLFTEDEVCKSFDLSHLDFRKLIPAAELPAPEYSTGLQAEIFYGKLSDQDAVAARYNIPVSLAAKYLAKPPMEVAHQAILDDLAKGILQKKDIAAKHKVSPSLVSKLDPKRRKQSRGQSLGEDTHAMMRKDLERYSVSEVARMYNVSRGYVYANCKTSLQATDAST